MPNHIKNRITFNCNPDKMDEIFKMFNTHNPAELRKTHDEKLIICNHKTKEYDFCWFDPKTAVCTGRGEKWKEPVQGLPDDYEFEITEAFDHFPDFRKIKPQPENIFLGDLSRSDEEKCHREGIPTWLDWNRENWGTKWNCYSCEKISWNSYQFQTAWSGVPDLICEMSKKIGDIEIKYIYASEDTGNNTGHMIIKNGEIECDYSPENESNEAYEIYLELNPDCDYVKLIDGKYTYIEEDI